MRQEAKARAGERGRDQRGRVGQHVAAGLRSRPSENAHVATAAISPMPAASPSRPSTKFIALTIVTTSRTDSRPPWFWSSDQQRAEAAAVAAPRHPELQPLQTEQHQHAGGGDLPGELGQRVQLEPVVEHADDHDHAAADQHRERVERVVERPAQHRQLVGEQHAAAHAAVHGEAAHPRHRHDVHVAGRGQATAPMRIASCRTSPVSRYVRAAAVRATSRYSRTGRPAGVASGRGPTADNGSGNRLSEDFGHVGPADRALAQHLRGLTGQVDDGRRHGFARLAAVQVHRHRLAAAAPAPPARWWRAAGR